MSLFEALLLFAMSLGNKPAVSVSVVATPKCIFSKSHAVEAKLILKLSNTSGTPISISKFAVARQRFYEKTNDGRLRIVRTSADPEELIMPQVELETSRGKDTDLDKDTIDAGQHKTMESTAYIYLSKDELKSTRNKGTVLVSFEVTGIEGTEGRFDFWSAPVSIPIPMRVCEVQ